jgi:hypothetical protein
MWAIAADAPTMQRGGTYANGRRRSRGAACCPSTCPCSVREHQPTRTLSDPLGGLETAERTRRCGCVPTRVAPCAALLISGFGVRFSAGPSLSSRSASTSAGQVRLIGVWVRYHGPWHMQAFPAMGVHTVNMGHPPLHIGAVSPHGTAQTQSILRVGKHASSARVQSPPQIAPRTVPLHTVLDG